MKTLPDPPGLHGDFLKSVGCGGGAGSKTGFRVAARRCRQSADQPRSGALALGDDALIERALDEATSRTVHATLTRALEAALEPNEETSLAMRVFAIPLLIVTISTNRSTLWKSRASWKGR